MKGRRRVTFVADSDAWGGAEVYLTHLLRRGDQHSWTASLVCAEPVAARFAEVVPDVPRAVVALARHTLAAPDLEAAIRAQEPDVVHVNLVDPASNAAAVAAALSASQGGPTTATLHLGGDTAGGPGRAALADLYSQLALLVTPARDIAAQVAAELTAPSGGLHVVANGVDIPADPAGPAGAFPVRIGAHGRLTAQKGYDLLMTAVAALAAEGRPVQVVLGGAGRDEAALRRAAAGLPVTFVGFVRDARAFLAGLDVFVLPSRRDALPLSLLEAMAEGLPCVASDVGDVAVATAGAAMIIPREDPEALAGALAALLDDPALRASLGVRARTRAAAALSADLMAERTYALLAQGAEASPLARGRR